MKRKTVTAREQPLPANTGNGGKIPGASRRPNQNCANRSEISVPTGWNGKSGIPRKVARLFRKNFRSNCAFNLQLNRSNRKFCLNGKRPRSTSLILFQKAFIFSTVSHVHIETNLKNSWYNKPWCWNTVKGDKNTRITLLSKKTQ